MRTSHRLRPRLEGMEPKALLSGAGGVAAAVVAAPVNHTIHLNGTISGHYSEHQSNPDFPKVYDLFGSGDVGLKATTALAGSLYQGGFTTNPTAHGELFLANRHGTITVKLTADTTHALPDQFDYKIVGGTGAYKHDNGSGSVVLILDKSKPPTTTTTTKGVVIQHGTFDLVFVG